MKTKDMSVLYLRCSNENTKYTTGILDEGKYIVQSHRPGSIPGI